jgi:hypothetical protein
MTSSERYRQHAAQCIRASRHATTPGAQHVLLYMAQRWSELAEKAEKGLFEDQRNDTFAKNLLKTS